MMYDYHGWEYGNYGFGFMGFLGAIAHFLFWVFVILFVLKLIKRGKHSEWSKMWHDKGAMGVLRERYAKGEIGKEEYEEKKKVLES